VYRRVNTLHYVKTPIGRWQWEPIPKDRRTGGHLWSKAMSNHICVFWREEKRRTYQKAGSTPSEALEAKRRKGFELAGRALLQEGKQTPRPQNGGFTIEAAVADFLEFTESKKCPNTYKRHRAVLAHFRAFAEPYTQVGTIAPAQIDAER